MFTRPAPATAADQRLELPALHAVNNRKVVMAEFTAASNEAETIYRLSAG